MNKVPWPLEYKGPRTECPKVEARADPISKNWGFYYTSENIPSVPKKEKPKSNALVQTKPVWTGQRGTQTTVACIETQTDEPITPEEMVEYPETFVEFIRKVTPALCEELEENSRSDQIGIFDELLSSMPEPVLEKRDSRKMFSFKNKAAIGRELTSATMTWSHNGRLMATCYSSPERGHGDFWCHHTSVLALYDSRILEVNAQSAEVSETSDSRNPPQADKEWIDLDYCFTVLEFSRQDGSILALGKANGTIILMDFTATEGISQITSNSTRIKYARDDVCHSDKIVALQWIVLTPTQIQENTWKNPQPSNQFLISASRDGFVGLWSLGKVSFSLHLEKRFALLGENLPESTLVKNNIDQLGITSLSCSESDPTKITFSTFGSFVFSGDIFSGCQISAGEPNVPATEYERPTQIPLYDPDAVVIASEADLIIAVHSSPFHQTYVLTLTLGGHLTLQNSLNRLDPTLEFYLDTKEASRDVKWSPHRPMMFAVTSGPNLFFYDLLKDHAQPSLTLKHECELKSIKFNKSRIGEIVVSDVKGEIFVWDLSPEISHRQPKELAQLIDLKRRLH